MNYDHDDDEKMNRNMTMIIKDINTHSNMYLLSK